MRRKRYLLRRWRSERGSQGLEAAGAALAAALIVLALLGGARGMLGPRVEQAFQCAASVLVGGGGGCGGGAADTTGTPAAQQDAPEEDDGGFGLLDGIQLGLDVVGLVPGLGEIADGVNGVISLARGDKVGAALSFAAMIPFAGWAATGGKWVKTGIKYSDEIAGAARYGDEAAAVAKRLPCISSGPPSGKGPGLAKPLFSCVNFDLKQLQTKFKHAGDFGVPGNYNKVNAEKFRQALEAHVTSPNTQVISGTYRGVPVQHYFDPTTGLNVIADTSGEFISGWKLSPDQIRHVTTTGNLGGG
jgi:hypothetical protein